MYPFLLDLHRAGRDSGLAALQLRYRVRGYNEGDPVADVEWALSEIARRHGDVPVCMVGHSMGARSVLRCAGHESVRAVVALAPWLPPGEPTFQLAGRTVVMAHGTRDRTTSPARSLAYALAAREVCDRLCRFEVAGSRHAMLERGRTWQRSGAASGTGGAGAAPLGRATAGGVRAALTGRLPGAAVIWFPRIVGLLTALYGVSALLKPDVIARHGELASTSDRRSAVALLSVTVGIRDMVSGIAIVLAPAGGALLAVLGARVAFDAGDAAAFGRLLPTRAPAGRWPPWRWAGVQSRRWP